MRDALIKAMQATADIKPVAVDLPAWGTVYVRPVMVSEVEEHTADAKSEDRSRLARGCARVLCDEQGARLFDAANVDDVALLASQPWALMRRVLEAAEEAVDPGN